MKKKRVIVIGLDGVPPRLLFHDFLNNLPNIKRFLQSARQGRLESTHPPITTPAWMCMMTGKDPGELGIYGFRNRREKNNYGLKLATSQDVKYPAVWDILSQKKKKVITVGVPLTYPPKPINGYSVSCLMTPGVQNAFTYPASLKEELMKFVPDYKFDLENFRTDEKKRILEELYEMTRTHFTLVRHLLSTKPWDFFMFVEIGTDRLHHGFWKYFDPLHPKYKKGNPFEKSILQYYQAIDQEFGEILQGLDDNTTVFLVSDHGAKAICGGIAVNQFLINEGYLKLKKSPRNVSFLEPGMIDWRRTKAWGEGGYYARIFLNVKNREPEGIVSQSEYAELRGELKKKIEKIPSQNGKPLDTRVLFPEKLYREVKGAAPDLMVYFDNLGWRSLGTVGYPSIYVSENDTGPDDANHDHYGIFAMRNKTTREKRINSLKIQNVAGMILEQFALA